MDTQDLINKRDKFKKWISVAALAVTGFVVAPFIFLAIGGLFGLVIAAALGITVVQLAPWFSLKVANLRYRLIDAEKVEHIKAVGNAAADNPIETLTALLIAKNKAFEVFRENVENATAARDTFRDKVQKFASRYPNRAAEFQAQYQRTVDMVDKKKKALNEARKSLEDGQLKLEEMKAYYEMSKDVIELNKAAGMDTGDAFEKLKADTACDAVFESMNKAFAQLEVAASLQTDEAPVDKAQESVAQLSHVEPTYIDMKVNQTIAQKVSSK